MSEFEFVEFRFRVRRRTAASWTSLNEVLLDSEIGLESDTRRYKIGDGVAAWNTIAYSGVGLFDLTGLQDGDALIWNQTTQRFEPAAVALAKRLAFSFGDASPSAFVALGIAAEVMHVSMEITTPFDGSGASLSLGTPASPDVLMAAGQNAPGVIGVYETAPRTDLLAGDIIHLTIVPGAGATQGAGQLVLTLV